MATTYCVATAANGGNNANNGSVSSPWLTVAYACKQVTTSGDRIFINDGVYIETERPNLFPGVSLIGASAETEILKWI